MVSEPASINVPAGLRGEVSIHSGLVSEGLHGALTAEILLWFVKPVVFCQMQQLTAETLGVFACSNALLEVVEESSIGSASLCQQHAETRLSEDQCNKPYGIVEDPFSLRAVPLQEPRKGFSDYRETVDEAGGRGVLQGHELVDAVEQGFNHIFAHACPAPKDTTLC